MEVKNIKITDVNQFSDRDRDYYINSSKFSEFLQYDFDYNQFSSVFNNRKEYDIDRQTLVRVLNAQYEGVESSALTQDNIKVLNENKTFTVTTAHQPSLLGGPLYYIYKILSAIKLSQRLNADYPGKRVIPVFVIGGEDHDFEEINHLHVFGKKIEWSSKDSGPVGRFSVEGIEEVINHVKDILGENSKVRELCDNLKAFAQKSDNYAAFSFKFTHALFDKFGLVILRMDELDFKRNFIPSIKKEVLESPSKEIIAATQEKINALDYKAQTHIRDINFFYVKAGFRNRIEKEGDLYKIVDKDITFSEQEMIKEIENHPERFSPNVIMRPLFQSLTLPDLAYIGGGGELAYWMERKSHFALFGMHFPMLIRRKSAMILSAGDIKQSEKLGLSINALFGNENDLIKTYSGGMKRRINIAAAILHNPKVLFMDEPTVGVDPQSRNRIFEIIENLNNQGMTIVYTTHYMEEVERLCDRIAIMDSGKIIAQGTQSQLKSLVQTKESTQLEFELLSESNVDKLRKILPNKITRNNNKLLVESTVKELSKVITACNEIQLSIKDIQLNKVNLEAIFLNLTGKQLRD